MLTYKLVTKLTNSQVEDWDALVVSELGEDIHPQRKIGYIFAREALRLSLAYEAPEILELRVKNYHQLEKWPEYTLSLSHSRGAGAAVVASRNVYRSVGIDLELSDRLVKPEVITRISNVLDAPLKAIEIWCSKEAAFKCLMNTGLFKDFFGLSQIQITQNEWSHSASGLKGQWELKSSGSYLMVIAWLKV